MSANGCPACKSRNITSGGWAAQPGSGVSSVQPRPCPLISPDFLLAIPPWTVFWGARELLFAELAAVITFLSFRAWGDQKGCK